MSYKPGNQRGRALLGLRLKQTIPKKHEQACGKPLQQLLNATPVVGWRLLHKKLASSHIKHLQGQTAPKLSFGAPEGHEVVLKRGEDDPAADLGSEPIIAVPIPPAEIAALPSWLSRKP